ncbi:hypothetical protein G5714_012717 [Onychostoma macrolepis]|uniref:SEA domain-containing protein n=1 Tax=Onychostoma macrolepis TaxID=369639 RepID=A0A7J6CHD1_9TELE|nr:hypothetical protein G5714_012717 [Onychostoma macrolepis]
MKIPQKALLIFCLVAATTAQISPGVNTTDVPRNSSTTSANTPTTTVTTKVSPGVNTTDVTRNSSTTSANTPTTTVTTKVSPGVNTTDVPRNSSTTSANTPTTTVTTKVSPGVNTTDVTRNSSTTSANTPTTTVTTKVSPGVNTTDVTRNSSTTSANTPTTTVTTKATEETNNGTFTTDTTTNSTNNTQASTTAATTASTTQGPCALSPCTGDSTCEERFGSTFACICRPGLVYLETTGCIQRKVFPGTLSLNRTFVEGMDNRGSKLFQETAGPIEEALRNILRNDDGYINSTVLSLRAGSIIADVENFYELSSSANSQSVENLIVNGQIPDNTGFISRDACATGFCDRTTTTCDEKQSGIATCTCKAEYIKSPSTSQACLACPNGEKATDNSEGCEKCPFGFSGFNCDDPYLLVVVVVSTVLGALLIIFIVALIVVSCRNPKESSSSQVDFSSSYGNKELHKPAGVPRIPRANPDASWNSNNLEMANSGSNQALVTRDRPESKARYTDYDEDMSYRAPIPPAYSGYGGRGVENGGAHNPYFRQDDDRMRRY